MRKYFKRKNFRHEYKYLLSYGNYLQLSDILKKTMDIDSNADYNNEYHIRSLYFDDIYNSALIEKEMGILNRKKYRIRIYNYSDNTIKLEEKNKSGDYISKKSTSISKDEYKSIYYGNVDFLLNDNNDVKKSYYIAIRNKLLKPKIIVDYIREAYILPYNEIRVTFDKNLGSAMTTENIFTDKICTSPVFNDCSVILEVKYNNFIPNHIKNIIELFGSNRLSVSKYYLCREKLKI